MRTLFVIAMLLAACAGAGTATAQSFPARQITLIVPFAAGGTTDVTARIVSEHMSRTLGQPIVIENIVGAGGTVGSTRAMRAAPDGYIIEMGQMGTHAAAVALHPNLAYRPDADFAPVGMVSALPALIIARKDFPAHDLREFIPFVKANFGKLNVAHSGVGSIYYTTCLLLHSLLDVKPTLVPFNGGAPAINAVAGGQVDYMCGDVAATVSLVQAGAIKAYAVGTAARNPMLPDVPTSTEAGLPEFDASAWNGLFAPRATPQSVLDRLTDALDKALDDENTRRRLMELGSDIPDRERRGPHALAALVRSEIARWTPIIKAAAASVN
jgi:tripartite-type tricarboxylate transporter receptor subunit TctC